MSFVLFAGSEAYLLARGNGSSTIITAIALGMFCFLTWWLTRSNPAEPERAPAGRLIAVQILACAFVVVATTLQGWYFNHMIPAWLRVPGWSALRDGLMALAAPRMPPDLANGVANFLLYCIPVAVVLLALGIPLAQQGLGRFRRGSAASAVVWLVLPLAYCLWSVASGRVPLRFVGRLWLGNLLQNGFSEEFLWRGAVMGRLRAVMTAEGALYLQALLFGLWHLGTNMNAAKGNLTTAVAMSIANQAVVGLALGYVTLRTGNIAVGSVFHLLYDSVDDLG